MLVVKRAIKKSAGAASVFLGYAARRSAEQRVSVLCYHRVSPVKVTERRLDDWNVTPATLERHIASLVETAELIFVRDVPERLTRPTSAKPLVCLTFDDGYGNFHDEVLPILQRYQAKATVFVVSAYLNSPDPMPFDKWGVRHAGRTPAVAWRPLTWRDLERCAGSGLVEIGGHSHRHANAATVAPEELVDETLRCRHALVDRLGPASATSYAYPYGSSRLGQVTPEYVEAVKAAGFERAVTTDLGLATPQSDPFLIPRVEVYRSDGVGVVQAKVLGSLAPYFLTDRLRRARR